MKSVVQTQRQFRRDFPDRKAPARLTIKHLLDKFREMGSVQDNCTVAGHLQSGQKFTSWLWDMFRVVSKEMHKAFVPHWTDEKKIHPGTEVEARSGHGYCDLSAGWSNIALLQCFTRIPPSLLYWRQTYLPSCEPPLACTFSRPISFGLFFVEMPTWQGLWHR